jgi:calcineurin-like phosphoesterase
MQTNTIRILFVGDIVGDAGRKVVIDKLSYLKDTYAYDISIANIENLAGGFGITKETYDAIEPYFDAFTTGNHRGIKKIFLSILIVCLRLQDHLICQIQKANLM